MITALEAAQMQARMDASKRRSPKPPPDAVKVESDLHDQIIAECHRRGWIAFHSRMDMRTGRPCGEPDLIILGIRYEPFSPQFGCSTTIKTAPAVWFIECKSRLGKLRPAQQGMIAWAAKLGHQIHVVRSFSEFLEVLK